MSGAPDRDVETRIGSLEEAMNRIENQLADLRAMIESSGTRKLAGQMDEVLQKLKAHQHDPEDGRAYIMEKREL